MAYGKRMAHAGSSIRTWRNDLLLTKIQAVLVLKYIVPEYGFPTLYLGVANVIANGLIMLRYVVLISMSVQPS